MNIASPRVATHEPPADDAIAAAALSAHLEEHVIQAGVAQAAVAAVVFEDPTRGWRRWIGAAGHAHPETPFDLASITKPFLAVTVARLVERGELEWSTPLELLLPEVSGTWAGSQPLARLLSHRASLVPHLELFRDSWQARPITRLPLLRRAANARRREVEPEALYSDLGYLLVGAALSQHFGRALDRLVHDHLLAPLSLEIGSARMWRRRTDFTRGVAPTEIQGGRGGLLRGVVHDDNAWAFSGTQMAGHAGLFGTATGLLDFAAYLLEGHEGRGPLASSIDPLLERRPGGSLRLGFDGVSGPHTKAGKSASVHTFGHLGFTGTSLWCDPERRAATVLLTNRVHPSRDNPRIHAARPEIQQYLWSSIDPALSARAPHSP